MKKANSILLTLWAAAVMASSASAQYVNTLVPGVDEPWGVAPAPDGNLYVTDSQNNRLLQYSISGGSTNILAAGQFSRPLGIVAARGGLVVADQYNQVIRFVTYNGTVTTLAGSYRNAGYFDSVDPTSAQFSYPIGVTADSSGNIFVADWDNGLIREISTNNAVSTVSTGGYEFNGPLALTFDSTGDLWIADSGDGSNVICELFKGNVTQIAGSGIAGGQFSSPSGLAWDSANNRLIIADSGHSVVSALSLVSNVWTTQILAGISNTTGDVNGGLSVATFNYPVGVAVDTFDSGYYIADYHNNAVRVLQPSAPLPPVTAPVFGYVTFPGTASPPDTSVFVSSSGATFYNSIPIAIEAEQGTQTFFTYGPTGSQIPMPTSSSPQASVYPGDGTPQSEIASAINPGPGTNDITIYAVSAAAGRQTSPISSARFIFQTANPQIIGDNAANIQLTDLTSGALIYYSLNSPPTNDGSSPYILSGDTLSLNITSNVVLYVQAAASGFASSSVMSELLTVSNFVGNQMTFGFAGGVASSRFIGAAGQTFYAPVTLTFVATPPPIYSLQFDLVVTNLTGPALPTFNPGYESYLMRAPTNTPPIYYPIPPGISVTETGPPNPGILVNNSENLLEIGYITAQGVTNLYNSQIQYLTEYSLAGDTLFSGNQIVVGGFSFLIPSNAPTGSTYLVGIANPSASTAGDVVPEPVVLQAPTNGSYGAGAINAIKHVTVGSYGYLEGDVYPLYWYNAGDFGDYSLQNVDVIRTFVSAIEGDNIPPAGSDYFDAMDCSNANTNGLFNGDDTSINSMAFGDGVIDVGDVYVVFRRSLDPSLVNYIHYWTNGQRIAIATNNSISIPQTIAAKAQSQTSVPQLITVAASQVNSSGNLTVQVPIRVTSTSSTFPVRVLMLGVEVDPLDGSPAITNAVSFAASSSLSTSNVLTTSFGANTYGGAWLDSTVPGVSGTNVIGTLTVTLPPNVTSNSAYLVHFDHFSASPNGIANFVSTIQDGLITTSDRSGSSWHDGIPDSWRLLYFDSVSNLLSAASADPDGDGANNWQEYIAGTNPQNPQSVFQFTAASASAGSNFTLQWPSVVNKSYAVQCSSSLSGGWVTLTNFTGNGQTMQWTDPSPSSTARFYRASVH